ncbi:MAG TPA: HPF/RaiA family ribosome-associated protein [Candidatus Xenobia bacterium]|jgi:hypothetical protein
MQTSEITVEGIHIQVKPQWESAARSAIAHLDARHPGSMRRVDVRFRPIKSHRDGVQVAVDGRIDHVHFHAERAGDNVVALVHECFALAERQVAETKAKESNVRAVSDPTVEPAEANEEDSVEPEDVLN